MNIIYIYCNMNKTHFSLEVFLYFYLPSGYRHENEGETFYWFWLGQS